MVLLLGALVGGSASAVAKPADPGPPANLMVSVAIGPASTLAGLRAFVDAVKPGTSAQLTDAMIRDELAKAAGVTSLDGLDPAGWTYVLIAGDSHEVALLGKVADPAKLLNSAGAMHMMTKDGWAAIGPKPLLERIGPYAFAVIATQPTPTVPTATVYLPHVLTRFATELHAARTQAQTGPMAANPMMRQMMDSYIDGLSSLANDTEALVVRLETSPSLAWLDFALTPRRGSRLAAFIAQQHATDYALLGQLPAAPVTPALLLAGHLELGPYRDGILGLMAAMYASDAAKALVPVFEAARKAMSGDIAMSADFTQPGGMTFTQLYGATDATAAGQALGAMLAQFKTPRTLALPDATTTIVATPGSTSYDGVTLRSYDATTDYSKAAPNKRQLLESMNPSGPHRAHLAAFDKVFMMVMAKDGLAVAKRTIDAARGKAAHLELGSATETLLAASRAHKDSVAMTLDIGAIAKLTKAADLGVLPVMMSLGFADRNAHIGMAVPLTTARSLMHAGNP